jgi:hypothetical protein
MTLETEAPLQRISEQLALKTSYEKSWAFHSVPVGCSVNKEPVLLGVDEAGRGPVLGALCHGLSCTQVLQTMQDPWYMRWRTVLLPRKSV